MFATVENDSIHAHGSRAVINLRRSTGNYLPPCMGKVAEWGVVGSKLIFQCPCGLRVWLHCFSIFAWFELPGDLRLAWECILMVFVLIYEIPMLIWRLLLMSLMWVITLISVFRTFHCTFMGLTLYGMSVSRQQFITTLDFYCSVEWFTGLIATLWGGLLDL